MLASYSLVLFLAMLGLFGKTASSLKAMPGRQLSRSAALFSSKAQKGGRLPKRLSLVTSEKSPGLVEEERKRARGLLEFIDAYV